jgi:hypothetical protein
MGGRGIENLLTQCGPSRPVAVQPITNNIGNSNQHEEDAEKGDVQIILPEKPLDAIH